MIHILQNKNEKEDEVLRNDCKPVRKQEFGTPELRDLVEKMQEAAHQEPDGVALAAPQIGANKTIFVIGRMGGSPIYLCSMLKIV